MVSGVKSGGGMGGGQSDKDIQAVPNKVTNRKISYPKLSVVELNFPIGMTWVRLIWFSRKRPKKHFRTQGEPATGD